MNRMMERQKPLIERSGMGLLPGIGFAFALALLAMAALVIDAWWVTVAVLLTLFVITGAVVWVVVQMTNDGDE
jgi:Flp pilus assembly protein TadB